MIVQLVDFVSKCINRYMKAGIYKRINSVQLTRNLFGNDASASICFFEIT